MDLDSSRVGRIQGRLSSGWLRAARLLAIVTAVALIALFVTNLLFTPVRGNVLVLLSAKAPDRVDGFTLDMHSTTGSWTSLGRVQAQAVPAAPATAEVIQASAPIGIYDSLRIGGVTLPVRVQVTRQILATILISISGGQPIENGVYAGSEGVSLGLNELSGQLRPVPAFDLIDQFGRPFTNLTIAGHVVILAAFHTTCHETCPLVTGLFLQLRKELPAAVLLAEVTTSPSEDTPEVLRAYAGRIGAAWTFVTGDPKSVAAFWKPFDVQLSSGDVHQSTLAVIDAHGYIRSFWLGAPDVGNALPAELLTQLSAAGLQLLATHGNNWGVPQVLGSVQAVGGLAAPSSAGEGPAPDFALSTLDGKTVRLGDFRGRPVLINFWATYCVPCRIEMPLIQKTASTHHNLIVLLVDERDDRGAARQFVSDLHISSTVVFDGDGRVGDLYAVTGLPTTVFVRGDGTIEGRYIGQTNEQILGAHVSAIGA